MKNYKGNMLLIELVIVLLFFALSQVVIVQLFATSQQRVGRSVALRDALNMARDVAEGLSVEEQPDVALIEMGFMGGNGSYIMSNEGGFDLYATIKREEKTGGELITTTLTAMRDDDELLTMPCAYYAQREAQP